LVITARSVARSTPGIGISEVAAASMARWRAMARHSRRRLSAGLVEAAGAVLLITMAS
jgi:hypothetical protein